MKRFKGPAWVDACPAPFVHTNFTRRTFPEQTLPKCWRVVIRVPNAVEGCFSIGKTAHFSSSRSCTKVGVRLGYAIAVRVPVTWICLQIEPSTVTSHPLSLAWLRLSNVQAIVAFLFLGLTVRRASPYQPSACLSYQGRWSTLRVLPPIAAELSRGKLQVRY